jgi:hypothetical protein
VPPLATTRRLFPWVVRAAWAILPLAAGPALAAALHPRSVPVRTLASVGLWAGWAGAVCATLVPSPTALTVLRLGAPAAVGAAAATLVVGHPSAPALAASLLAGLSVFVPETALLFVNAGAYPNERRFPLRAPGPLLLGPVELAWALALGGPATGSLLLAAGQWVEGALVLAAAAPASVVLVRALHGLARRWLVFVPAGLVIHDPITLTDPVLLHRRAVASLRPAARETDALDLTRRAIGLALEVALREDVAMTLVTPGRRRGRSTSVRSVLVSPTRPGAVLAEAKARRLPVG